MPKGYNILKLRLYSMSQ